MIQFLGVTKKYRSFPKSIVALNNVSFEIQPGEFVFLVGASGSGKTTILRHLIREESPSEGKIYFDDQDITRLNRGGVYELRRRIGIIFQDYKLIEEKTAAENIAFAMEAAGQSRQEIKETVPYVLDIVNLTERARAFPKELSGGEKQRVAIARAISNNPRLLIADEPTGNLDPSAAWDIVQILDKINKWGTTIIMSTHDEEVVDSLQKRVLKLEKGQLIRDDRKGGYDERDSYSQKPLKVKESGKAMETDKTTETNGENKPNEETESSDKKIKITDKSTSKSEAKSAKNKTKKKIKVKETLAKADASGLEILKITPELRKKLEKEGFGDIEDILKIGVAEVNKKLEKSEIKELAQGIKKFLTTE